MADLICDCGMKYQIRDDTPGWAAPWFMCPECFLADGKAKLNTNDDSSPIQAD